MGSREDFHQRTWAAPRRRRGSGGTSSEVSVSAVWDPLLAVQLFSEKNNLRSETGVPGHSRLKFSFYHRRMHFRRYK